MEKKKYRIFKIFRDENNFLNFRDKNRTWLYLKGEKNILT